MTGFLLATLAVCWLAIVVPAGLRAREVLPFSASERFKRRAQLIAPRSHSGRWVLVPAAREELERLQSERHQARRRTILSVLTGVTLLSAVAAAILGGVMLQVALICSGSLSIYVALLIEAKRRRLEPRASVQMGLAGSSR